MCFCMYRNTNIQTHTHACTYTSVYFARINTIRTYESTWMCAYIQAPTYMHKIQGALAYIHKYIHVFTTETQSLKYVIVKKHVITSYPIIQLAMSIVFWLRLIAFSRAQCDFVWTLCCIKRINLIILLRNTSMCIIKCKMHALGRTYLNTNASILRTHICVTYWRTKMCAPKSNI